jgi:predicted ABC-type sugar transport system permease subunit
MSRGIDSPAAVAKKCAKCQSKRTNITNLVGLNRFLVLAIAIYQFHNREFLSLQSLLSNSFFVSRSRLNFKD